MRPVTARANMAGSASLSSERSGLMRGADTSSLRKVTALFDCLSGRPLGLCKSPSVLQARLPTHIRRLALTHVCRATVRSGQLQVPVTMTSLRKRNKASDHNRNSLLTPSLQQRSALNLLRSLLRLGHTSRSGLYTSPSCELFHRHSLSNRHNSLSWKSMALKRI